MAISKITTPTQLSLAQELASINSQNKVTQIQPGNDQTIDDFWKNFVDPALPDPNTVIKWFRLLSDYVDQNDAVFALRCYGNWKSYKTKDNYTLRRGFYNLTDIDYSFFYTDNFFAAYFAKMAVDIFVPTLSEFKTMMLSREFPARFGRSAAVERDRAAYSIDGKKGKNPDFNTNGYKIAHVVDSGKRFFSNGLEKTIGQICDTYCDRGDYKDWKMHNDSWGDFYARDLKMDPAARELLVAHFLRFACPMNYIFTPKIDCHILGVKVPMNDIAECVELQQYAMHKFHARYGKDYDDYLDRIMLPPGLTLRSIPPVAVLGAKTIDIEYAYKVRSGMTTAKTSRPHYVHPFKSFLGTVINSKGTHYSPSVINSFFYSLQDSLFKQILNNHVLPFDIFLCTDITKLKSVYDEIKQRTTIIATQVFAKRHGACTSALRNYVDYLRNNSLVTNDLGQLFN
jgi:hypothetical protein